MHLNHLFHKAVRGEEVTPEEVQFSENHLESKDVQDAIMANSILLRAGGGDQRTTAYDRLRRICKEADSREGMTAATFLLILELFSKAQFQADPCFAEFVYRSVGDPFLGARINAMRVLRQLATIRDQKAIELLKESINDSHPYVSATAKASLKLAGIET